MNRLALLLVLGCCVAPDQMRPSEDDVTVATPDGDFETVGDCAIATRRLTVTNTRDTELQIEVPQVDGFIITPSGPQTLSAFAVAQFEVKFESLEKTAGTYAAMVVVNRIGGGSLGAASFSASVPADRFPEVEIDFLGVGVGGAYDATATFDGVTFEPGDEAAFTTIRVTAFEHTLRFAPTAVRSYATTLMGRREGRCPLFAKLRGDGVDNVIGFEPIIGNFTGRVGQPSMQTMTFSNFGRPLQLTNIKVSAQGQSTQSPEFTGATVLAIPSATRSSNGALQPSTADLIVTHTPTMAGSRQFLWTGNVDLVERPTLSIPLRAVIDP